jgi:hypothetical protein
MRRVVLGSLLGVGLIAAAVAATAEQRGEFYSQRATALPAPAAAAGSEMIVVPTSLGDRGQMLTIVDPRQRVFGVYHVELPSGKITLKSVRNIQWDLQMAGFNNEKPTPQEIQSQLSEQK